MLCPSPAPTGVPGRGEKTRRPSGGQRKRAPRRLRGPAGLRRGWSVSTRGPSLLRGTLPTPVISPRPAFPTPDQPPPIPAPLSRPWAVFPEPFQSHHFCVASMASLTSRTFHLRAPAFVGSPLDARELAVQSLSAKASSSGGRIPCYLLAWFLCLLFSAFPSRHWQAVLMPATGQPGLPKTRVHTFRARGPAGPLAPTQLVLPKESLLPRWFLVKRP